MGEVGASTTRYLPSLFLIVPWMKVASSRDDSGSWAAPRTSGTILKSLSTDWRKGSWTSIECSPLCDLRVCMDHIPAARCRQVAAEVLVDVDEAERGPVRPAVLHGSAQEKGPVARGEDDDRVVWRPARALYPEQPSGRSTCSPHAARSSPGYPLHLRWRRLCQISFDVRFEHGRVARIEGTADQGSRISPISSSACWLLL